MRTKYVLRAPAQLLLRLLLAATERQEREASNERDLHSPNSCSAEPPRAPSVSYSGVSGARAPSVRSRRVCAGLRAHTRAGVWVWRKVWTASNERAGNLLGSVRTRSFAAAALIPALIPQTTWKHRQVPGKGPGSCSRLKHERKLGLFVLVTSCL